MKFEFGLAVVGRREGEAGGNCVVSGVCAPAQMTTTTDLLATFHELDKDGDGTLNVRAELDAPPEFKRDNWLPSSPPAANATLRSTHMRANMIFESQTYKEEYFNMEEIARREEVKRLAALEEMKGKLALLDADGDGEVTAEEMLAADLDGDGVITEAELEAAAAAIAKGAPPPKPPPRKRFVEAENDGRVQLVQWLNVHSGRNPPYVPKSKPSPFGAVEATWAKAMVACLQCKAA